MVPCACPAALAAGPCESTMIAKRARAQRASMGGTFMELRSLDFDLGETAEALRESVRSFADAEIALVGRGRTVVEPVNAGVVVAALVAGMRGRHASPP